MEAARAGPLRHLALRWLPPEPQHDCGKPRQGRDEAVCGMRGKQGGEEVSQCEQLIRALRKRAMTYGDLLALRVSTSPWKRLSEGAHLYLRPHERLERFKRQRDGLVVFKVTRATRWTA